MPWALFVLNKKPPLIPKNIIFASIVWALLIVSGAPEISILTLFLGVAQSFFNNGQWKKQMLATCLSLFIACFLTAIQLLPSLEMLSKTDRGEQSRIWPLELIQLLNITFPDILGNDRQPGHNEFWGSHFFDRNYPLYYSLYMGFGTLLLAAFALKKRGDRKNRIAFWTAVILLLLSCGRYSPFFFLYRLIPIIGSIRYPVKFFLGSVFCLSLLASLGYQAIEEEKRKGTRRSFLLMLIAVSFLGAYWIFKGKFLTLLNGLLLIEKESSLRELGRSFETGLFLFSLYALLISLRGKNIFFWRTIPIILLLLAILDPVFHNRYINPTVPVTFFEKPALIDSLGPSKTIYRDDSFTFLQKEANQNNTRFLRYLYQTLYPYSGIGDNVRYVFNSDLHASYPRDYRELMKYVRALPDEAKLKTLRYIGCSLAIGERQIFSGRTAIEREIDGLSFKLQHITHEKPSPFLVFQSSAASTVKQRLEIFVSPMLDPWRCAVTSKRVDLQENIPEETKVYLQIKKEIQGRGWYSLEVPSEALLIIPGNYAKGWRAWVDGKSVEVIEANLFSKGIPIPPGHHDVEIRYLPMSFVCGAIISLFFSGVALIFLVSSTLFKRHFGGHPTSIAFLARLWRKQKY